MYLRLCWGCIEAVLRLYWGLIWGYFMAVVEAIFEAVFEAVAAPRPRPTWSPPTGPTPWGGPCRSPPPLLLSSSPPLLLSSSPPLLLSSRLLHPSVTALRWGWRGEGGTEPPFGFIKIAFLDLSLASRHICDNYNEHFRDTKYCVTSDCVQNSSMQIQIISYLWLQTSVFLTFNQQYLL